MFHNPLHIDKLPRQIFKIIINIKYNLFELSIIKIISKCYIYV